MTVRIGVVGTSWWTDAMYLPALRARSDVSVEVVAGRDPARTAAFAERWEVARAVTDIDELLDLPLDAVIVASANDSHH
ncbi:MAG: Gfo/Idh/MocA family oxidoreductase, partial [Actinobacteria bacterium]|nr:Gfo/Idh/MocA family oxidoreductase [Actinomycetota bacterium]NIS32218.1 Gfo/Idh/MocA family oxidoreductase [Actinomycetota bacterium]NIT96145.1 Gfo/Idh/MocA family oxidoreductase [Actinomycetota bacterium]NIU19830.1 Gfo/Idh/MocA family oxidoreductase [Actinomycetota bacterium]NIU67271.1 Gfo/Idh/MocA family oxidoreductase [Actinomycetota bacterium]